MNPLCPYCGKPVEGREADARFPLDIEHPDGSRAVLVWHYGRSGNCAEVDPLHAEFADTLLLPDGREAAEAILGVYLKILDRAIADAGEAGLRATVEVRRDCSDPRVTLRGPGAAWGRWSRVPGALAAARNGKIGRSVTFSRRSLDQQRGG